MIVLQMSNEDLAIDQEDANASSLSQEKPSRFATSGEHLDFNFEAYDQDICILGSKGSGKSYLANTIMKSLNGIHVWVYDFNHQFHSISSNSFQRLDKDAGSF